MKLSNWLLRSEQIIRIMSRSVWLEWKILIGHQRKVLVKAKLSKNPKIGRLQKVSLNVFDVRKRVFEKI